MESYDGVLRRFQEEQGMPVQDWTAQALNRVKGAPSLAGRDQLRDALTKLGFGLK